MFLEQRFLLDQEGNELLTSPNLFREPMEPIDSKEK